ncbi:MAG: TonB-dependent receptor plug domain-containing protein [Saprospiraceae bacterium]|nr:TonB-dependent receptor plug domain-containing protein [Saprospiraceae bacterium]
MRISNALFYLLLGPLAMIIYSACGTTGAVKNSGERAERVYQSLFDMLRAQPELTISGSQTDAVIRIRGNTSIEGNNDPLFVVNGTPAGHGYASVQQLSVDDIESIRVLPRSQAGIYGARGINGVILIKTK